MQIEKIEASVVPGDENVDFASVVIDLADGSQVGFFINQSTIYPDAINVEIDADLVSDDPSLRIHLNDQLIVDTKTIVPEAIEDERPDPVEPE